MIILPTRPSHTHALEPEDQRRFVVRLYIARLPEQIIYPGAYGHCRDARGPHNHEYEPEAYTDGEGGTEGR